MSVQVTQQSSGDSGFNQSSSNDMKYEINRLHTFKTWPASIPINPKHLAEDGFVFLGIGDRVRCVFCDVKLSQWKGGDVVSEDHTEHSPSCPFKLGENVGNIPMASGKSFPVAESSYDSSKASSLLGETVSGHSHSSGCSIDSGYDSRSHSHSGPQQQISSDASALKRPMQSNLCDIMESMPSLSSTKSMPQNTTSTVSRNIILSPASSLSSTSILLNPKHPKYMLESSRLDTFKNWLISVKQTPKEMAQAGFYYLETGDRVKCFCCDGNLMNWDPEDVPLVEHEKFYPQCNYIKLVKTTLLAEITKEKEMNEKNKMPPKVLAVIDFGFSYNHIKDTLTRHNKTFDHFHNADSLLNFILDKESNTSLQQDGMTEEEIDHLLAQEQPMDTRCDTPDGLSVKSNNKIPVVHKNKSHDKYLKSVVNENKKLKSKMMCRGCERVPACVIYLPCGHRLMCESCATRDRNCNQCAKPIKGTVRSYLS